MASLSMNGPYPLTAPTIAQIVPRMSPGNYALGYERDGTFIVRYVGCSDSDVNSRLDDWVGVNERYLEFKFSYASSAKGAFEKECRNYHDFTEKRKLDNDRHPDAPEDTPWRCPVCAQ